MNEHAPYLKQNGKFIVRNITADRNKSIKIFNYPINYNTTRDLLQIPGIAEDDIRASLLKGELYHKLKAGDIIIEESDVDLLQFCEAQNIFLKQSGITEGTEVESSNIIYDDNISSYHMLVNNVQDAIDFIKDKLEHYQNKLIVGKNGDVDYTSVSEAVAYAISQGASLNNRWEIEIQNGVYFEPQITIQTGITITSNYSQNLDTVVIRALDVNNDLIICNGGILAGLTVCGVTDPDHCLIRCNNPNAVTNLFGIALGRCSKGIWVSNGARAAATSLSICIKDANKNIDKAIHVDGYGTEFCLFNSKIYVPENVLSLYDVNPIQTCINVTDQAKVFVTGSSFCVRSKDNTADVICCDTGSLVSVCGTEYSDCNIANHIGPIGDNSQIVLQSCVFRNNYLNGFNESSTGSIFTNVSIDRSAYSGVAGATLAGLVQYQNTKSMNLLGDLGYIFTTNKRLSLPRFFSEHSSSGIIEGGIASKVSGLNLNVTSGRGWIKRNITNNDVFDVEWDTNTITLPINSASYIVYDSVSNSITSQLSTPSNLQICFAEVVTDNSEIRFVHSTRLVLNSFELAISNYLLNTRKFELNSGMLAVAGTTNKKLTISSGSYYVGINLINYSGSGTDGYFSYFYGTDGYNEISNINEIDDLRYDLSGVLTEIEDGYYKSDIAYVTSDGRISVIYGTDQYTTLEETRSANIPNIPTFINETAFAIAKIITQKSSGIVEFFDIRPQSSRNVVGISTTGIVDHSLLGNLDKDTHSQYLLITGSRNMTGNLNMGGNEIENAGLINDVNITDHSIRHNPGGLDALSIGSPVSVGTSNFIGTASSYSLSDHVHSHGNQLGGSLHANASGSSSGFMSSTDKTKLDNIPSEILKSILLWGNSDISSTTAIRYLSPYYASNTATLDSIQFVMPYSGTLKNMYVRHNTVAGNGNNITYTLRKGGVATSLTVTLASTSNQGSDLIHNVSVAQGDLIDIEITKAAGIGSSPNNVIVSIALV